MCHVKPFGDDGDQPPLQTIITLHALEHRNHLQLQIFRHLLIPWAWWGCLLIRGIPKFHCSLKPVCQSMTFFQTSSFDCNFPGNDNQTFNVYTESTLSIYRKGLCSFFLVLKFAMEDFLCRIKCCEYFGPEGVPLCSRISSYG